MKHFYIALFCLSILSISAQEKNFKEFYKSHKKEAELSLNIPSFVGDFFIDNQENDELEMLLDKSSNYKILIYDDNSDQALKEFKNFVKQQNLKTIVKIKEGKDRINIHFREVKNRIKEIVVNINSTDSNNNKEVVLIGLKTNLTMDELSELMSSSGIEPLSN